MGGVKVKNVISDEVLLKMYSTMKISRYLTDALLKLTQAGEMRGAPHLCYGEEAIGAGLGAAVEPEDYVMPHHRCTAQCIGMGLDLGRFTAMELGRADGYNMGRGHTAQSMSKEHHTLPSNGIIGSNAPLGMGAALGMKYRGMSGVLFCLFGDGGTNQGMFHEALNLAKLWKLPIIFVCVNNQFAISTRAKDSFAPSSVADFATVYRMPSVKIDGNDAVTVYYTLREMRKNVVENGGPAFVEMETYRLGGHYVGDDENYRGKEEVREKWLHEPIVVFDDWIRENRPELQDKLAEADEDAHCKVEEAKVFAQNSPRPDPANIWEGLYIQEGPAWERRDICEKNYRSPGDQ